MMGSRKEKRVWSRAEGDASELGRDAFSRVRVDKSTTNGRYRGIVLMLTAVLFFNIGPVWGYDASPINKPDEKEKPPPPTCPPQKQSKEPINYFTGAERPKYTDLVVKGEYPINFGRRYDSQATYDSPMGYGWSHGHDRRLYEYPDNSVVIRHDCGLRTNMVYTGGAYVTSPGGQRGTLEEQGGGSYIFTYLSGSKDYFDTQGRLEAVEDKRGNRLEYTYSSTRQPLVGTSPYGVDPTKPMTVAMTWQLKTIRERLADGTLSGNQLTLSYSATTGRLQSVTDQSGRSVTYTHDELDDGQGNTLTAGNLIQVDGPEGMISSYQYNDTNDNHNLTGIQKYSQAEWVINTYT
ncbi:MAG: hypothetical protein GY753_14575, partial [Gammaproteobacteria bacterium]|nr:hypothetical protein [Gammaproteobacteria bacterium]